jgi:H+/Cl- antiporter ClcA
MLILITSIGIGIIVLLVMFFLETLQNFYNGITFSYATGKKWFMYILFINLFLTVCIIYYVYYMNAVGLTGSPGITGYTGMKGASSPPCVISYCTKNYSMLINNDNDKPRNKK